MKTLNSIPNPNHQLKLLIPHIGLYTSFNRSKQMVIHKVISVLFKGHPQNYSLTNFFVCFSVYIYIEEKVTNSIVLMTRIVSLYLMCTYKITVVLSFPPPFFVKKISQIEILFKKMYTHLCSKLVPPLKERKRKKKEKVVE